ncbi:WD40 repeat-like protein [Stereum hirsutum FP-91666 SS1]|uniref:WD40 repeat-like protein n=1 Tax=Stereum hirsutum (strain FP-91666) TaxID=721885 RepID=R7RXE7_STEHR|nr:WD40 repeat-like protein [Stereum hirsutum FP-91666 SS1]EIM79503.1 WD40 repeat-like protein [Stereum hirsutum FP-91666 SS1]
MHRTKNKDATNTKRPTSRFSRFIDRILPSGRFPSRGLSLTTGTVPSTAPTVAGRDSVIATQSIEQGGTFSESESVPSERMASPAKDIPLMPTVEEARAEQAHSRAYLNMMRTCGALVHVLKAVEPFLEGTPFRTPLAVLTAIADVVETVNDTSDSAEDTLDTISRRLTVIENALTTRQHLGKELSTRIDKFANFLVQRAVEIQGIRGTSAWIKVSESEDHKKKITEVVRRIQDYTTDFSIEVMLAIERDTKSILELLKLDKWLRAPAAMYRTDEDAPVRRHCTEGTRTGVLERIKTWATDTSPSSPHIFCLTGMAGTGKSTIAYTICREFDRENSRCALGASFFCSRQSRDLCKLGNLVPTVACQLARHSSSFGATLLDADPFAYYSSSEQMDHLLIGPWQRSKGDRPEELPPTLIVIDALDEIDQEGGHTLLKSLIDVVKKTGSGMRGIKFLTTSRPHPDIVTASESLSHDSVYRLEEIKEQDGRADILKYLDECLPELKTSSRDKINALADLSGGLFIYAATAVHLIAPPLPAPRLSKAEQNFMLSRIIRGSNRLTPDSDRLPIDVLYLQIVRDCIGSDKAHYMPFRLTILHGIACARQPLSVNVLSELVSEASEHDHRDTVRQVVEALYAVVYISNDRVYMYHKSFSDFIFDSERCTPQLACKREISHGILARGCFRVMDQSLRFNICNLPSSFLLDSEVDNLAQSLEENVHSIDGLTYVCRYWWSHLIEVVPSASQEVQSLLDKLVVFSEEKVLFWIEVMNLLRAKGDCRNGVDAVMRWLNKAAVTELQMIWTAVSKLIKSFLMTRASLSTAHLYISCLASVLATNYRVPDTWRVHFPGLPKLSRAEVNNYSSDLVVMKTESAVSSVAFSPDGMRIVSGLYDSENSVCIWDVSTGEKVQKLKGYTRLVTSVAFSPNGKCIILGSEDNSMRIWDVSTGEVVKELRGHTASVQSVAFSSDGMYIISGSGDHSVRIWDTSTGEEVQKLEGHTHTVFSAAFSPDGMHIVSCSGDRSVRIWDVSTGKEVQKLEGHTHTVFSAAFSPDGMHIVSCSGDRSVRIWDVSTGEEVQKLDGHTDSVQSVGFSTDGNRIISGSSDHSVRIWDVSTGEEVYMLQSRAELPKAVAFSIDGVYIVSGWQDGRMKIWDISTGEGSQNLKGPNSQVLSVGFSSDGTHIVSGSADRSVRIWDASTGEEVQKLDGHTDPVRSVGFSSDGIHVVSGSDDHSIRIWDVSMGEEVQKLRGHTDWVNSVAFSPDGIHIVSSSTDKLVCIWDTTTGEEVQKLKGHTGWVNSVTFSSDGMHIVSGSGDESVRIWNASTGEEVQKFQGHTHWVRSVAFSPNGVHIVSGSNDESVRIWDTSTGEEVLKLRGHTSRVNSVAFSPDGIHIVSGSDDWSVRIWDASTGVQVQRLEGHTSWVNSVAFSSDGTRIVSGSSDESVRIWDVSTGGEVQELKGHPVSVNPVAFCSNETCIVPDSKDLVRTSDPWTGQQFQQLDWKPGADGWVIANTSQDRLLWLPSYLHGSLRTKHCRLVISGKGSTTLDFSSACLGPDWKNCYNPTSSNGDKHQSHPVSQTLTRIRGKAIESGKEQVKGGL